METVGEAIAAGKDYLAAFCGTCRITVHTPWQRLPGLKVNDRIADLPKRLYCQRCGARPEVESVRAGAHSDAHGRSNHLYGQS